MKMMQDIESVVMLGEEWSQLRYRAIDPESVKMFAIRREDGSVYDLECGKDFELDAENGTIRRTPDSCIGDYANSPFYGQESFDHGIYCGNWGNYPYMVYISYVFDADKNILIEDEAAHIALEGNFPKLSRDILSRLMKGEKLTYLVYGDSISTGCEAIRLEEAYFSLFADRLERITGGKIEVINRAIGGENSRGGVARFKDVVDECKPHLVSIAYGINDMCIHDEDKKTALSEVSIEEYRNNIVSMLNTARDAGAEVFFVTNCIPNSCWKFTSLKAGDYPEEMRRIAKEMNVPLADCWRLWEKEQTHGKTLHDLLLNDVNHPTTYGHGLYAQMLYTLL